MLVRMTSGRFSPGNKLICRLAVEEPGPLRLRVFKKSLSDLPLRYFSLNSSLTINAFSSIKRMMESVVFSLVPLGIFKVTSMTSEATLGKKEVCMIPPPIEPIVKIRSPKKMAKVKNECFKLKRSTGL